MPELFSVIRYSTGPIISFQHLTTMGADIAGPPHHQDVHHNHLLIAAGEKARVSTSNHGASHCEVFESQGSEQLGVENIAGV